LLHHRLPPVRALVTTSVQQRLCTIEELSCELDTAPRNHSAFLRRALTDVLDGAQSAAEAEAVDLLRTASVPPFELNVALVDNQGNTLYVVDMLWRDLRAVLEIDSREFHFAERDWAATLRRHNALTRAGLAVTHYRPREVRTGGSAWAAEVACWLRQRAAELGVDYRPDPQVLRCVPARPLVVPLERAAPWPADR